MKLWTPTKTTVENQAYTMLTEIVKMRATAEMHRLAAAEHSLAGWPDDANYHRRKLRRAKALLCVLEAQV